MKKLTSVILSIAIMITLNCPALAVSGVINSTEAQRQEQLVTLAYMNLDQASEEMKPKITEAREEIIFSQAWVVDGVSGFILDKEGNVVEEVPQFYELFPTDWEVPVFEQDEVDQVFNTESVMPTADDIKFFYNDFLTLSRPASTTNTPAFCTCSTSGTIGSIEYDITRLYASAYYPSSSVPATYNLGYTNAATGQSLGWKENIPQEDIFSISTDGGMTVAVRASTYDYPSDDWHMIVTGDMEFTNVLA